MRLREVVRLSGSVRHINWPTSLETLTEDVRAVLLRSRVNRLMASDRDAVGQLARRLRGGERVRAGGATYDLLTAHDK